MSCSFDREIIQKYVDNTIDPLEYIFLKEHLAYCKDCKREVELLTLVDNNLCSFFNEDMDTSILDALAEQLVNDCVRSLRNEKGFVAGLKSGIEISRDIVSSTVSFASYIPGSRLVKKGVSSAAGKLGSAAKDYLKNKVKKALPGQGI